MHYVFLPSYAWKIGPIVPSRCLRLGDPLSPYLFIMCAEVLSGLIKKYEEQKWLHGVKICRHAPSISHMLFADDNYLYVRADEEDVLRVLDLLQVFENASGQNVNLMKSTVFFSSNVSTGEIDHICQLLQMVKAGDHTTYLGLPSMLGRNKSATIEFIKDKVQKRVQTCYGKWISQGGNFS